VQFFARQRARAMLVAGATAGLIAVMCSGVWDFSKLWARAPRTAAEAQGITIAVENINLGSSSRLDYVLRGVPENLGITATADHLWRWPDGTGVAARSNADVWWSGAAEWRALGLVGDLTGASAQTFVAAGTNPARKKDGSVLTAEFFLSSAKKGRLANGQASYAGELHAALVQPRLEFELPLRAGDRREATGFSVRITRAEWVDGEWQITFVESRPAWGRYGSQRPTIASALWMKPEAPAGFALVNRTRGEAVKLWPGRFPVAKLLVGTQELAWITLQCRVPGDDAVENSETPPRWLEGATLAVVRYHEVAQFDREVKVERFGAPANGPEAK
jgi:hypothetical protein